VADASAFTRRGYRRLVCHLSSLPSSSSLPPQLGTSGHHLKGRRRSSSRSSSIHLSSDVGIGKSYKPACIPGWIKYMYCDQFPVQNFFFVLANLPIPRLLGLTMKMMFRHHCLEIELARPSLPRPPLKLLRRHRLNT
jgi:hypothetical protein